MGHSVIVIIFGLNCGPGPSFSSDIWIQRFWGVVVTEHSPFQLEFQAIHHHHALDDHALNCPREALDSERGGREFVMLFCCYCRERIDEIQPRAFQAWHCAIIIEVPQMKN